MYYYHAIAILSGNRTKTLPNRSEETIFSNVACRSSRKASSRRRGAAEHTPTDSYQVLELRIIARFRLGTGVRARWMI